MFKLNWIYRFIPITLLSVFPMLALAEPEEDVVPAGAETFDCGIYRVSGKLGQTEQGYHVLSVYPETTREYEIVLYGFPAEAGFVHEGTLVSLMIEVQKEADASAVKGQFRKFLSEQPDDESLMSKAVTSIESKACAE